MYSNNIVNSQESMTILNANTKKILKLIVCTSYLYFEGADCDYDYFQLIGVGVMEDVATCKLITAGECYFEKYSPYASDDRGNQFR